MHSGRATHWGTRGADVKWTGVSSSRGICMAGLGLEIIHVYSLRRLDTESRYTSYSTSSTYCTYDGLPDLRHKPFESRTTVNDHHTHGRTFLEASEPTSVTSNSWRDPSAKQVDLASVWMSHWILIPNASRWLLLLSSFVPRFAV